MIGHSARRCTRSNSVAFTVWLGLQLRGGTLNFMALRFPCDLFPIILLWLKTRATLFIFICVTVLIAIVFYW